MIDEEALCNDNKEETTEDKINDIEKSIGTVDNGKKKKGKAKISSLIAQIIAAVWVAVWSAMKFVKASGDINISDVIFSGFAIAACFSPVYFSLILDKIKNIRFGDN